MKEIKALHSRRTVTTLCLQIFPDKARICLVRETSGLQTKSPPLQAPLWPSGAQQGLEGGVVGLLGVSLLRGSLPRWGLLQLVSTETGVFCLFLLFL